MDDAATENETFHSMRSQLSAVTPELFLTLIKRYTTPNLEVSNVVAPHLFKKDISLLDRVQRRANKCVMGVRYESYEDRLQRLGLFLPSFKRTRGGLTITIISSSTSSNTNMGIPP